MGSCTIAYLGQTECTDCSECTEGEEYISEQCLNGYPFDTETNPETFMRDITGDDTECTDCTARPEGSWTVFPCDSLHTSDAVNAPCSIASPSHLRMAPSLRVRPSAGNGRTSESTTRVSAVQSTIPSPTAEHGKVTARKVTRGSHAATTSTTRTAAPLRRARGVGSATVSIKAQVLMEQPSNLLTSARISVTNSLTAWLLKFSQTQTETRVATSSLHTLKTRRGNGWPTTIRGTATLTPAGRTTTSQTLTLLTTRQGHRRTPRDFHRSQEAAAAKGMLIRLENP